MAVTKFPIIRLALWISLTLSLSVWSVRTVRAGLELPPFYADVHERLIENPLIGSTDFYYIVRYLRCLSQLDDLEREWMSMAESDDQRAAYKILLGGLALERGQPEVAKGYFDQGDDSVYGHYARALWQVRHGDKARAFKHLELAREVKVTCSQYARLTELLAEWYVNQGDVGACIALWREGWHAKDAIADRLSLLPGLCNWLGYLGGLEAFAESLPVDRWEDKLYAAEVERLSGNLEGAQEHLSSLSESDQERMEVIRAKHRLALDAGEILEGASLILRLAWEDDTFSEDDFEDLLRIFRLSRQEIRMLPAEHVAKLRKQVGDYLKAHPAFITSQPLLALRWAKRNPVVLDILKTHLEEKPDDWEASFTSLEMEGEQQRAFSRASSTAVFETRKVLALRYRKLFDQVDRESRAMSDWAAARADVPTFTRYFWQSTKARYGRFFPSGLPQGRVRRTIKTWCQPLSVSSNLIDRSNLRWVALLRYQQLTSKEEALALLENQAELSVPDRLLGYQYLEEDSKFLQRLAAEAANPTIYEGLYLQGFFKHATSIVAKVPLPKTTQVEVRQVTQSMLEKLIATAPKDRFVAYQYKIRELKECGELSTSDGLYRVLRDWTMERGGRELRALASTTRSLGRLTDDIRTTLNDRAKALGVPGVDESAWLDQHERALTVMPRIESDGYLRQLQYLIRKPFPGGREEQEPSLVPDSVYWSRLLNGQPRRDYFENSNNDLTRFTDRTTKLTQFQKLRAHLYLLFHVDELESLEAVNRRLDILETGFSLMGQDLRVTRLASMLAQGRDSEALEFLSVSPTSRGALATTELILRLKIRLGRSELEEAQVLLKQLSPRLGQAKRHELGTMLQSVSELKEEGDQWVKEATRTAGLVRSPFVPPSRDEGNGEQQLASLKALLDKGAFDEALALSETLEASHEEDWNEAIDEAWISVANRQCKPANEDLRNHPAMSQSIAVNLRILRAFKSEKVTRFFQFPYLVSIYNKKAVDQLSLPELMMLESLVSEEDRIRIRYALVFFYPSDIIVSRPDYFRDVLKSGRLAQLSKIASSVRMVSRDSYITKAIADVYLEIGKALIENEQAEDAIVVWNHFLRATGPRQPTTGHNSIGRISDQTDRLATTSRDESGPVRKALVGLLMKSNQRREAAALILRPLTDRYRAERSFGFAGSLPDARSLWWEWDETFSCKALSILDGLDEQGLASEGLRFAEEVSRKRVDDGYLAELSLLLKMRAATSDAGELVVGHLNRWKPTQVAWYAAIGRMMDSMNVKSDLIFQVAHRGAKYLSDDMSAETKFEIWRLLLKHERNRLPKAERDQIVAEGLALVGDYQFSGDNIGVGIAFISDQIGSYPKECAAAFNKIREQWDEWEKIYPKTRNRASIALMKAAANNGVDELQSLAAEALIENTQADLSSSRSQRYLGDDQLGEAVRVLADCGAGEYLKEFLDVLEESRVPITKDFIDDAKVYYQFRNDDLSQALPFAWLMPGDEGVRVAWGLGSVGRAKALYRENEGVEMEHFVVYDPEETSRFDLEISVLDRDSGRLIPLFASQPLSSMGSFDGLAYNTVNPGYLKAMTSGQTAWQDWRSLGPESLTSSGPFRSVRRWKLADPDRKKLVAYESMPLRERNIIGSSVTIEELKRLGSQVTRYKYPRGKSGGVELCGDRWAIDSNKTILIQSVVRPHHGSVSLGLRFIDQANRYLGERLHSRRSAYSFASWEVTQIRLSPRAIPPQCTRVEPFLKVYRGGQSGDPWHVDIASVALWTEDADEHRLADAQCLGVVPANVVSSIANTSRTRLGFFLEDRSLLVTDFSGRKLCSVALGKELKPGRVKLLGFAGDREGSELLFQCDGNLYRWPWSKIQPPESLGEFRSSGLSFSRNGKFVLVEEGGRKLSLYQLPDWKKSFVSDSLGYGIVKKFSDDDKFLYLSKSAYGADETHVIKLPEGEALDREASKSHLEERFEGYAKLADKAVWKVEPSLLSVGSQRLSVAARDGLRADQLILPSRTGVSGAWWNPMDSRVTFVTRAGSLYRWTPRRQP